MTFDLRAGWAGKFMTVSVSILLVISLISCKDEDKLKLPEATQVGAGTFGCKANGKSMIAYRWGMSAAVTGTNWIRIVAETPYTARTFRQVNIVFDSVDFEIQENVRYEFDNTGDVQCWYITIGDDTFCKYEAAPVTGGVTFTRFDREARVISGIFDFSGWSDECNASVDITEGRFDMYLENFDD